MVNYGKMGWDPPTRLEKLRRGSQNARKARRVDAEQSRLFNNIRRELRFRAVIRLVLYPKLKSRGGDRWKRTCESMRCLGLGLGFRV